MKIGKSYKKSINAVLWDACSSITYRDGLFQHKELTRLDINLYTLTAVNLFVINV